MGAFVGEWPLSSGLMCVDPGIANRNDTESSWRCGYCHVDVPVGALHQCCEDHAWEEPFTRADLTSRGRSEDRDG